MLLNLAKAMEVQVNLLLRQALAGAPPQVREVSIDGIVRDVTRGAGLSLGQLGRVIAEGPVAQRLVASLHEGAWLTGSGAYVLRDVARHRNPAAHGEPVSRAVAERLRNQLLGVGCQGDLVRLAAVRLKQP